MLYWLFPLLWKRFLFWYTPIYFCYPCLTRHIQTILLKPKLNRLLLMFSSWSFMISGLIYKSLIHFEYIIVYGIESSLVSFLFKLFFLNSLASLWGGIPFPWLGIEPKTPAFKAQSLNHWATKESLVPFFCRPVILIQFSEEGFFFFLACIFLHLLSCINSLYECGLISRLSSLFHWSVCLFLCQYQTVLITIAL